MDFHVLVEARKADTEVMGKEQPEGSRGRLCVVANACKAEDLTE
jgi:hypothetical protein